MDVDALFAAAAPRAHDAAEEIAIGRVEELLSMQQRVRLPLCDWAHESRRPVHLVKP